MNMAEADEGAQVQYKPNVNCDTADSMRTAFEQSRNRDQVIGSTQRGPQRDDLVLTLHSNGAKEYASDGQQRGFCIALRIAQARIFEQSSGISPVLLADDVLGELDGQRKAGFWRSSPKEWQIIASGTELPVASEAWAVWDVLDGAFRLR